MTETSNRISVQSGFSEFSFEHNDDALLNSTPRSQEPVRSPSKSPMRVDGLLRENIELKAKVSEQAQMINQLKNEIYELQQEVKQKDAVKDNSAPKVTETPEKVQITKLSELSPPPRSANRARTSPLKCTPDSANTTITQLQDDNTLEHEKQEQTSPLDFENELSKTPNQVTRESSTYSEPPEPRSESPKKNVLSSNNSSPYKGRIQNSSPLKSASNALSTYINPSVSETPQTHTSPSTARSPNSGTDNKKPQTGPQLNLTPQLNPASQAAPSTNGTTGGITNGNANSSPYAASSWNSSVPSSPSENKFPQTLVKSNLYDPYEGDFQHQQIRQFHNGYGGSYNVQSPSLQETTSEQDAKHQRFPSDVPLFVSPTELSTVRTEIISTICGNLSKKSEDPYVVIAACDRQTGVEMWRFKKTLSNIIMLDTQIRPLINSFSLPPVPEKALFLSNIPVKVDIRRLRLRDYFTTLFTIPHLPLEAAYRISRFMSQDVVNLVDESNTEVLKDGFLLRRSKGLGNSWKARYCQVDGPFLNVFDAREGPLLEIIKLTGSQIGRQPDNVKVTDDKTSYRHAFAVMEPKKNLKSSSFTKHIFCAETDQERDLWVNVLVQFVEESSAASTYSVDSSSISSQTVINQDSLPSPTSTLQSPSRSNFSKADEYDELEELVKESKRNKKRSFFPFSKKAFNEEMEAFKAQQLQQQNQQPLETSPQKDRSNIERSLDSMNLLNEDSGGKVFRSEIADSFKLSSHELYGCEVPSIIYRCLSYLIDAGAVFQEGLFRLNGSASLIKQLREDFDKKYDIDFNELDPKPDINSIAGLLKLYLRELPTTILTREHSSEYRDAYNQKSDLSQLSLDFKKITTRLPNVNQSLLYVLFKFLHEVIENQESNKMNLRNLCIVFSPTLNIASELIMPFLVDFKCIFEGAEPIANENRETLDIHIPTF